jgi:hypothetical protein
MANGVPSPASSQKSAPAPKGGASHANPAQDAERVLQQVLAIITSPAVITLAQTSKSLADGWVANREKDLTLRKQVNELNARYLSTNRYFFLAGLTVCLAFLGIVLWMFKGERDTLLPVLTALSGLIAGAGGGFIFGQRQVKSD